jgi:hypothetical protein
MQKHYFVSISLLLAILTAGCSLDESYQTMVERQLSSGVQNDSLFLGYHFGMTRQDFRDSSWEMNRDGILTGLVNVEYSFTDLGHRASMIFYPEFEDDKIVRIPVKVSYNAWAPWNEQFWPENLAKDLVQYYQDVYGGTFRQVYIPEIEKRAYVNIQGNREIRIYPFSENEVMADFINLREYEPNK